MVYRQLTAAAARVDRFTFDATTRPRALTGLAVARIGLAASQLSHYVADYGDRRLLLGPDGVYPRSEVNDTGSFNFYTPAGDSVARFEITYHLGLLACIAMLLGMGGRASIIAVWSTSWSLWAINPFLIDGGDNIAMIVLPLLALSLCCERLSIWRPFAHRPFFQKLMRSWPVVLLSNAAALGICVQICLVYFLSGMYKAQGEMWIDGTALYYIMLVPEYFYPPLTPLLLGNDLMIVIGTYVSMVMLIAFPFLVLSRRTRLVAVAGMLIFHLSIAVMMGLTSFALVMAACDCVLVSAEIEEIVRRFRGRRAGTNANTKESSSNSDDDLSEALSPAGTSQETELVAVDMGHRT